MTADDLLARIDSTTEQWDTWDGRSADAARWRPAEAPMTAAGHYAEVDPCRARFTDAGLEAEWAAEMWQERHADLAATLRTVLAVCAHTEQHHPGGPAHLARSIRGVIEQATEWPGR